MGKRLVPVSGSFRLPVLPSVEWEWEVASSRSSSWTSTSSSPPSITSSRARARTLSPERPARDRLW
jgi:hypothetical protein